MDLVGSPARRLELQRLFGIGRSRGQHGGARIGRHRLAVGAEQAMDRLAHRLAQKVPERDVDRADGAHAGRALLLPQLGHQSLAMHRVLAHQHGLEMRDQPLPVRGRRVRGRAQERISLDAVVGADAQQAERARAGEPAHLAVLRRRDVVPGEQGQRDVGDLHWLSSCILAPPDLILRRRAAPSRRMGNREGTHAHPSRRSPSGRSSG